MLIEVINELKDQLNRINQAIAILEGQSTPTRKVAFTGIRLNKTRKRGPIPNSRKKQISLKMKKYWASKAALGRRLKSDKVLSMRINKGATA